MQVLNQAGDRMRGFERRNDSFLVRQEACCVESSLVGDRKVLGAALIGKPGVLWTNRRIIQARGDGMGGSNLPVSVLQHVGIGALKNPRAGARITLGGPKARGMFSQPASAATRLYTHHSYRDVTQKGVEQADRIRTSANARVQIRRQAVLDG